MPWSRAGIERDWLGGERLTAQVERTVEMFNLVEAALGRDWVARSRLPGQIGISQVLRVRVAGEILATLLPIPRHDRLLARLRRSDGRDAWAEARAIHLLVEAEPRLVIELEPTIHLRGHELKPDLRVLRPGDDWVYVEVTSPGDSLAARRLFRVMEHLTAGSATGSDSYALEIFLRRDPTQAEVDTIVAQVSEVTKLQGRLSEELPNGLGVLFLNVTQPGLVRLEDHPGEADVPRLGRAQVHIEGGAPTRHIQTRIAYVDQRFDRLLSKEARQLSPRHRNLVMIEATSTSMWRAWPSHIATRFSRAFHTRIGGVCLFQSGYIARDDGVLRWEIETGLTTNPLAAKPLPAWMVEKFS